jgi:hypothetical protein
MNRKYNPYELPPSNLAAFIIFLVLCGAALMWLSM